MSKAIITQEELKQNFHYDELTGIFTYKKNIASKKVGDVAGNVNSKGYIRIGINYATHKAHRLAWLYMTGSFPQYQVDHINGNKEDNRWCNLREATNAENQCNKSLSIRNKSGLKGVSWDKKANKWRAQSTLNNIKKYLGMFESKESAYKSYVDFSRNHHKEFCYKGL
jgi:hypothetical protein